MPPFFPPFEIAHGCRDGTRSLLPDELVLWGCSVVVIVLQHLDCLVERSAPSIPLGMHPKRVSFN